LAVVLALHNRKYRKGRGTAKLHPAPRKAFPRVFTKMRSDYRHQPPPRAQCVLRPRHPFALSPSHPRGVCVVGAFSCGYSPLSPILFFVASVSVGQDAHVPTKRMYSHSFPPLTPPSLIRYNVDVIRSLATAKSAPELISLASFCTAVFGGATKVTKILCRLYDSIRPPHTHTHELVWARLYSHKIKYVCRSRTWPLRVVQSEPNDSTSFQ
jgi:hypothetical protein